MISICAVVQADDQKSLFEILSLWEVHSSFGSRFTVSKKLCSKYYPPLRLLRICGNGARGMIDFGDPFFH
jgi:hypothetical protein